MPDSTKDIIATVNDKNTIFASQLEADLNTLAQTLGYPDDLFIRYFIRFITYSGAKLKQSIEESVDNSILLNTKSLDSKLALAGSFSINIPRGTCQIITFTNLRCTKSVHYKLHDKIGDAAGASVYSLGDYLYNEGAEGCLIIGIVSTNIYKDIEIGNLSTYVTTESNISSYLYTTGDILDFTTSGYNVIITNFQSLSGASNKLTYFKYVDMKLDTDSLGSILGENFIFSSTVSTVEITAAVEPMMDLDEINQYIFNQNDSKTIVKSAKDTADIIGYFNFDPLTNTIYCKNDIVDIQKLNPSFMINFKFYTFIKATAKTYTLHVIIKNNDLIIQAGFDDIETYYGNIIGQKIKLYEIIGKISKLSFIDYVYLDASKHTVNNVLETEVTLAVGEFLDLTISPTIVS